jgi:NAD(P)-dependent dehydrogenase (short-subunit alcohol dehydrogenase family)
MKSNSFQLEGKIAFVTGATGTICSEIIKALGQEGAKIAIAVHRKSPEELLRFCKDQGIDSIVVKADVTRKESLLRAAEEVRSSFGRADILINGAGGNNPRATTSRELSFFDISEKDVKDVLSLNFLGTFYACQVFGKLMAEQKEGVILNISSMNAIRPLTNIPVYSASKAAVDNFTRWLAVHMCRNYSTGIRVNAIAPGFLLTEQNKFLLLNKEGKLTPRGEKILEHTPMGRFGTHDDLIGAVLWLVSPLSKFVTGIVVPVDGGFSAYSGV